MDVLFELGKVLLKVELSKLQTGTLVRELGGAGGEVVIHQKMGKYWNERTIWDRPDGLVVVTNQRLVFLAKVTSFTTTTDFLSFPLELIENCTATSVWLVTPAIRFQVQGATYTFTVFSDAASLAAAVNEGKKSIRA